MKYLGGKSRIAKEIAAQIAPSGLWWEPFCGGLSVSVALSKYGPGIVSDCHEALISLYTAVQSGWEPPKEVTREDHQYARSLPNSDPLKAFIGFGCSYQGMWFSSYYGPQMCPPSSKHPRGMKQDPVRGAAVSLKRDIEALSRSNCSIVCMDFFDVEPSQDVFESIYCDPPYAGTVGYSTGEFNHAAFWNRCQEWAEFSRVFVSELSCPVDNVEVWSKSYEKRLGAKGQSNNQKTEKLFLVLPAS